jgi:hypothetical protein
MPSEFDEIAVFDHIEEKIVCLFVFFERILTKLVTVPDADAVFQRPSASVKPVAFAKNDKAALIDIGVILDFDKAIFFDEVFRG